MGWSLNDHRFYKKTTAESWADTDHPNTDPLPPNTRNHQPALLGPVLLYQQPTAYKHHSQHTGDQTSLATRGRPARNRRLGADPTQTHSTGPAPRRAPNLLNRWVKSGQEEEDKEKAKKEQPNDTCTRHRENNSNPHTCARIKKSTPRPNLVSTLSPTPPPTMSCLGKRELEGRHAGRPDKFAHRLGKEPPVADRCRR